LAPSGDPFVRPLAGTDVCYSERFLAEFTAKQCTERSSASVATRAFLFSRPSPWP
jgi:hypothetical protein